MSINHIMERFFIAMALALLILNCGSTPPYYPAKDKLSKQQRQRLNTVARQYVGVPYRYGIDI